MPEKQDIVDKATALKGLGFSPLMIVVLSLVSTPGLWSAFLDDTDEKALAAIEKAYPVLEKEVEHLNRDLADQRAINQQLYGTVQALDQRIDVLLLRDGVHVRHGGSPLPLGGSLTPPGELFRDPAAAATSAGADALAGLLDGSTDVSVPAHDPGLLGDLIHQQRQAPQRMDLPGLGEILGKKE